MDSDVTDDAAILDLDAFAAAPLARTPYDHIVVPRFVRAEAFDAVLADFPAIAEPGSFPVGETRPGPAFRRLLDAFAQPPVRSAFEDKFGIDLTGRPLMTTVRGMCQAKDGRIHTDSTTKLITVLIYMEPTWEAAGGRLRILRDAENLEDYADEVTPGPGTLLAFRRGAASFHGHAPFVGRRRSVQINWVTSAGVRRREQARHWVSARLKKLVAAG